MSKRDDYLNEVCREVRFRAARKYLKQELSAHIDDKRAYLEECGTTDAEAEAVKAMGDPVQTGRALNAIHRPRVEWGVIACVLLLIAAGLAANYASVTYGHFHTRHSLLWGLQTYLEFATVAVSMAVTAVLMFANYSWLIRIRHLLFGVALIYIAFYVTVFTLDPNGEIYYWFGDGWLGPTAVAIIPAILFFLSIAGFAYRRKSCRIPDLLLLSGLSAISILAEHLVSNDYVLLLAATELVILLAVLAASTLSSAAKWRLAFVCVGVISVSLIFGRAAIDQFSNPFVADEARSILDGALFVGPSPVYLAYPKALAGLSEAPVLAAGISAYGWLFGIGVIGLFGALLTLMVRRSLRIAHSFGRFLALGICVWFGIQFTLFLLINLGFVGSVPVFLPFVSSDASFHLTDAALVGVFLSVWRRSSFMPRDAAPAVSVPLSSTYPAPPIR